MARTATLEQIMAEILAIMLHDNDKEDEEHVHTWRSISEEDRDYYRNLATIHRTFDALDYE